MAVILINPFEVPEGKEEEALAFWEKATDFMRQQSNGGNGGRATRST